MILSTPKKCFRCRVPSRNVNGGAASFMALASCYQRSLVDQAAPRLMIRRRFHHGYSLPEHASSATRGYASDKIRFRREIFKVHKLDAEVLAFLRDQRSVPLASSQTHARRATSVPTLPIPVPNVLPRGSRCP
jgi:hypothetical protein